MGYTHYWYRRKKIPHATWQTLLADFTATLPYLAESGVKLAGGLGEGEPEVGPEQVWFNGKSNCGHQKQDICLPWPSPTAHGVASRPTVVGRWCSGSLIEQRACDGNCSYETFGFPRILVPPEWSKPKNGKYFQFCKTAFRPYDLAVTVFLVIAQHHLGKELRVDSDGEMPQWQDAINLCQTVLGYGEGFKLSPDGT